MKLVRILAWREFQDGLHSRWLLGFGLLFAALTLGISYYGLAGTRQIGFQGFELVSSSLLNLVLFTVPLATLTQSILNFSAESGHLLILLTQPMSRAQVMFGKYLGTVGAVAVAILGGMALGGLGIVAMSGGSYGASFLMLMLLTAALILLFAAAGMLIAVVSPEKTKALGLGLTLWFVLVILYDLLVFGVAIAGAGISLKAFLLTALVFNPVDVVRVFFLLASGNTGFVGAAGSVLAETLGTFAGLLLLAGALVAWTAFSLLLCQKALARRDF